MVDIHHEGFCHAPRDIAFDFIDDYRNATQWMFGLSEFSPAGALDQGLGSTFNGTFHVTPIKLHSTIEVTEWEAHTLIAFKSIKGFANESEWRFTSLGDTETKITVRFTYQLPGGLAGKAMGRALEPIVALSVRHSDAALRKHIEEAYARSGH